MGIFKNFFMEEVEEEDTVKISEKEKKEKEDSVSDISEKIFQKAISEDGNTSNFGKLLVKKLRRDSLIDTDIEDDKTLEDIANKALSKVMSEKEGLSNLGDRFVGEFGKGINEVEANPTKLIREIKERLDKLESIINKKSK